MLFMKRGMETLDQSPCSHKHLNDEWCLSDAPTVSSTIDSSIGIHMCKWDGVKWQTLSI